MRLAPMPDSYDLDRGLLLAVQAIQVRNKMELSLDLCYLFVFFENVIGFPFPAVISGFARE